MLVLKRKSERTVPNLRRHCLCLLVCGSLALCWHGHGTAGHILCSVKPVAACTAPSNLEQPILARSFRHSCPRRGFCNDDGPEHCLRRPFLVLAVCAGWGLLSTPARALSQPPPFRIKGSSKPMPAVGYGTCCRESAQGQPLITSTKAYLAAGGRLIDTAQGYGNHLDIGEAIRQSAVPRDDLWVTSKVRVRACNTAADVVRAVNKSLEQLGLEYLDLMLLHGGDGWGIGPERDEALWRGLIETQQSGKVRSIGVSNHNREEIDRLISSTGVTPAVNQLEFHPWVPAETRDLVRWCQGKGIAVTAYGSLGGSQNKARGEAAAKIAEKYGKTSAQVLLRWALDQGVAVIPGASSEEHIREDLDLTGFALTSEDAKLLESVEAPTNFTRWHNCKTGCAA